jgi:hypothetical protein
MLNRDLYDKDPRTNILLNNGVAKVTTGQSDPEIDTLRYEISNFVCDGQYADGLKRILTTYLSHLDKSEQPGVWVSGFYGSGKSHLVKMLQHFWIDYAFPGGARARGLAKLPTSCKDLLRELSTAAKRAGGLHAAAGTLGSGAGESVRVELLTIIFRSVGLPAQYSRANFVMWLRHEEIESAVRDHLQKTGRDFDFEVENLYVSDAMARAILSVRPEFARNTGEAKVLVEKQFPDKTDVSIEEMITKIKQAIGSKGKLPCTLIVLDEVQQYIGDKVERSKAVQDVQEQCCSRLGANIVFVATGQNALSGIPLLQRLQGRFPVTIELQDTDVEHVTREVVLKKKPSAVETLSEFLNLHMGEIQRHLSGSNIALSPRDRKFLVQDYPILPVRRRFWERVLRAVDKAGTGAQLRNQLWVVFDAVGQTADLELGQVVSGAFIYDSSIKSKVLQTGVLLQEIAENIEKQRNEEDGELRYQLCALIFLIGQLPHEGPADAGIRASAETLSDLLVTDLRQSSVELRKKVSQLLDKLVASGTVMRVEDEYRMQTREGSEWNQAYELARNSLLAVSGAGKLASERSQLLKSHSSEILKTTKLLHGASKEARKYELHFGSSQPATTGSTIPVWIRDGWEVEENTVLSDARADGDTEALVFGFIPRSHSEELKQEIASYYAAKTTLDTKGSQNTPEGTEARKAMETRLSMAEKSRNGLINDILNETTVYLAGGDEVKGSILIEDKVRDAATSCLDRLFPQFHQADTPDWHKVIERARKGDGDALTAIGHRGDPETHPVCKAIRDFVGSGKKGTDIRKKFTAPPYGWPQDAIDAALFVLSNAGILQARSGTEAIPKGKLDQKNIPSIEFRVESITLSKVQLIALRGLFKAMGLNTQPNYETVDAPKFLDRMARLAEDAGGETPLPKRPDTSHLDDLCNRVGNDQLKAIHDLKDTLSQEISEWQKRKARMEERQPHWATLQALLAHASDLPVASEVLPEVVAIERDRSLIHDPDPVPGMVDKLTEALRKAINESHSACATAHESGLMGLEASTPWQRLSPEQRYDLLSKHGVRQIPPIAVGTTEEVLDTLKRTKISELKAICDALPTRFSNTQAAAVKLLEPKAQEVTLPGGTIKNEDDLHSWLSSAEEVIREKLKNGPVIV